MSAIEFSPEWTPPPRIRSRRGRFMLASGALCAYTLAFFPLYPRLNHEVTALSVIPQIAVAWLWGVRGGMAGVVVGFILNTILLHIAGFMFADWKSLATNAGPALMALFIIGVVVGRLSDMHREVDRQLADRQRVEDVLRERETRLRLAVESAPAILWSTDTRLRFTSSLGAGLRAQGLQPNQVAGMTLREYFQTDDPDFPPIAAHQKALRGEPASYRMTWNSRTYEAHVEPIREQEGAITGTVSVALDISERTAAEESLMKNQVRLGLINSIATGITSGMSVEQIIERTLRELRAHFSSYRTAYSTIDDRGLVTVVQSIEPQGMPALRGVKVDLSIAPEYLSALQRREPIIANDVARDSRLAPLAAVIAAGGTRAKLDVPLKHSDRLVGVLFFSAPEPRTWSEHEIAIMTEVAEYLSVAIQNAAAEQERKRAEEEAKVQRDFALHVMNAMGQGLVVTDPDFRFEYVNQEFARLVGRTPESLIGKTGFDVMAPEDHPSILESRERRSQGETVSQEVRLRHVDGHDVLVLATGAPRLRNGKVVGSITVTTDLTERKRANEIRLAKEAAEEANKAKGEFLSRMSHELRTPLNAILGFAQLLEMDQLSPPQRESVEHILHGGRHLLELINEVLDISRIDEGRLRISLEPVSVREVVGESLKLITPLAADGVIRIEGNLNVAGDRHVQADRQRLKQVLLNLLANAVKYNHKGGKVTVGYQENNGRLRINVSDTGPGIARDSVERLFTPFERLSAEQASVEGTGLGLALSKRLVEAMGGRIGVESTMDKGSTFWVDFAMVESPLERLKRLGGTPTAVDLDGTIRPRVVLYAEDNLANLKLVQYLLADRPEVRLLPAMHGKLALSLARDHRPHLILLDLDLADMSGEDVLRELKDQPETAHIPVVVISATSAPDSMNRLLAAGAIDYLTKPLDIQKLLALLDSLNERTAAS
ncbi:MAG: ATP-binding protein [Armatimonadota bacterium]